MEEKTLSILIILFNVFDSEQGAGGGGPFCINDLFGFVRFLSGWSWNRLKGRLGLGGLESISEINQGRNLQELLGLGGLGVQYLFKAID